MTERTTHLMLENAMSYLAELLSVAYVRQGSDTIAPKPGDITYEDHPMRNARFYFAIYRYETDWRYPTGPRTLTTHRPEGLVSYNTRELHDHVRFACELLRAHRGLIERAKGMGEL